MMRRKVWILAALGLLGGAGAGVGIRISAADQPEGADRATALGRSQRAAEPAYFSQGKTTSGTGKSNPFGPSAAERSESSPWADSADANSLSDDSHSEGSREGEPRRFKLRPASQPINYSKLFNETAAQQKEHKGEKEAGAPRDVEGGDTAGTVTISRPNSQVGPSATANTLSDKLPAGPVSEDHPLGSGAAPGVVDTLKTPKAVSTSLAQTQDVEQPISTLGSAADMPSDLSLTAPKDSRANGKAPLESPAEGQPFAPSLTTLRPVPEQPVPGAKSAGPFGDAPVRTTEAPAAKSHPQEPSAPRQLAFPEPASAVPNVAATPKEMSKESPGQKTSTREPRRSDADKHASPIPLNTASPLAAKPEESSTGKTVGVESKPKADAELVHAAHKNEGAEGTGVEQVSGVVPFPRNRAGLSDGVEDYAQPPARIMTNPPATLTPPRAVHQLPTAKARTSDSPFPEAESKYLRASHKDSSPTAATTLSNPARMSRPSSSPAVTTEWVRKSEIKVGKICQFDLVIRNTGRTSAKDVVIEAYFPPSVRLTQAVPAPMEKAEQLAWSFPQLKAGETQTIAIQMVPSKAGAIEAHAFVRLTGATSGVFTVEEPQLKVVIQGPESVQVGDPASQIVLVTNPGTGVANNVRIEARIPAGLEHARGERVSLDIGSLNAGESRTVRLALSAVAGGTHRVDVAAVADSVPAHIAQANIQVVAPSLKLTIDGPGLRYVGRNAVFTMHATNDGGAASNNVRIVHQIPPGYKFLRANKGGKLEQDGSVAWYVGRIEPGQAYRVDVELAATSAGVCKHLVTALAEGGVRTQSQFESQVEGSASLVVEIVDLDDPVEVGRETAYEVRVRNEGTKEARNVGLSCELPNGVELISAKGPTNAVTENGLVVYKSIDTLPTGKTAIFRVHVKGRVDGNHRFRARLASDSIQEPLIFEELTRFYKE